jgi:hypothetical protein
MKIFIKYILAATITLNLLMLIHFPNTWFIGDTISFFKETSFKVILEYLLITSFYSLLLIPFFIFSKTKYGWFPLAILSFFSGLEKYIFYLQGQQTPWNIGFNETMLINFLVNPSGLNDAYITYGSNYHPYLYLIIFPIGMFLLLKLISSKLPSLDKTKETYKYIIGISLGLIIFAPTFLGSNTYAPYIFRVQSTISSYLTDKFYESFGIHREKIFFTDVNKTNKPKNIVLIIDESIRGDLLSINNKNYIKETPFLYSLKDKIINFGNLYSTINCSYGSNELSINGFNKKLKEKIKFYNKKMPTIYQYMKNAKYNTYLIDNVHNGLYQIFKSYDIKYIDYIHNDYKKYKTYKTYNRDLKSLNILDKILHNNKNNFVIIIKYGIHFPFEHAFNHNKPLYKNWGKETPKKEFNMYLNALNHNIDSYWKKLIKISNNTDTVILYRSDHSVNITADKNAKEIRITHCESGLTYLNELHSIPGILYSPNKKYYKGYHNLKHGYSDKHFFSTLLDFAGYQEKDYNKTYGPSFKNPDKKIYIINGGIQSFRNGNDSNISDLINFDVRKQIHPLNKRRILENSLELLY